MKTWCPQCGPSAAVDEDGCCLICGCDAVGEGADAAHEDRRKAEALDALEKKIAEMSTAAAEAWRESHGSSYLEGKFDGIESVERLLDAWEKTRGE